MRFQLTKKAYDDRKNIAENTQATWGIEQRKENLSRLDESFRIISMNREAPLDGDSVKATKYVFQSGSRGGRSDVRKPG